MAQIFADRDQNLRLSACFFAVICGKNKITCQPLIRMTRPEFFNSAQNIENQFDLRHQRANENPAKAHG